MANKMKRKKKNSILFHMSLDGNIYKLLFNQCKKRGVSIQDRIRHLVSEDVNQIDQNGK